MIMKVNLTATAEGIDLLTMVSFGFLTAVTSLPFKCFAIPSLQPLYNHLIILCKSI